MQNKEDKEMLCEGCPFLRKYTLKEHVQYNCVWMRKTDFIPQLVQSCLSREKHKEDNNWAFIYLSRMNSEMINIKQHIRHFYRHHNDLMQLIKRGKIKGIDLLRNDNSEQD